MLDKIRKSPLANQILTLAGGPYNGLGRIFIRMLYSLLRVFPNRQREESRAFFENNKKRVRSVLNLLVDEESKRVYKGMVMFRSTMNRRYHPGAQLPQYFVNDIIHLGENEVFIDAGCFDGETTAEFLQCVFEIGYKRAVMFEPDNDNIQKIKDKGLLNDERNVLIEKACWDRDEMLHFTATGKSDSKIVDTSITDSGTIVPATAIDNCVACHDATFIKMDIEGAELKALRGAKDTILRQKPKLAICIYHSDSDMLDIIEYIHSLVPDYNVFVRHHSVGTIETVAYFTI